MMSVKATRRDVWYSLCPHVILRRTMSSIGMTSEDVVVNGRDCGVQESIPRCDARDCGLEAPATTFQSSRCGGSSRAASVSKNAWLVHRQLGQRLYTQGTWYCSNQTFKMLHPLRLPRYSGTGRYLYACLSGIVLVRDILWTGVRGALPSPFHPLAPTDTNSHRVRIGFLNVT